MSKNSFIDSIDVKTSCSEDWNEMKGDEKIRFCSHCTKSVNNISAMTRKQAMRVVRGAKGGICVRYIKNPKTNAPLFAGKLYQISRRAGIAAGVLGASLSLSTLAYAQNDAIDTNITKQIIESLGEIQFNKVKTENGTASVSGTITDPNGAVIPGVTIIITGDNYKKSTVTDGSGFYKFENLPGGKYTIKAEPVYGFDTSSSENITATEGKETIADVRLSLSLSAEMINVGDVAFVDYENPLQRAVSDNDLEEVKNLIAKGENVNGKDENYNNITPLFLAVENGGVEMVETLLNAGAKINARDKNKQTPLMRLDEDGSAELVRVLITRGAKINAVDIDGNTALFLAARTAKAEVLQILLDHDAAVNAQNRQGQTALMNAADADNLENVRALILAGADVNLKDNYDETALDLTVSDEIEELLRSHGAIIEDN